jgi:hypothetical protein
MRDWQKMSETKIAPANKNRNEKLVAHTLVTRLRVGTIKMMILDRVHIDKDLPGSKLYINL